ncbi:hypothetical protein [Saccharothrix sp. Mg75]|uniref:hypothetical protein n=1 Tax=Saccharothrix sp. Mg75 TaxID=3445357 RepID=UPI003EEA538D
MAARRSHRVLGHDDRTPRDLGQPLAADLGADGRWTLLGFDSGSRLVDLSGAVPTRELPSSAHLTDDLQHVVSTTTDATEIRSVATNDLTATLPRTVQTAMTVAPGTGILAVKARAGTD